MNNRGRVTQSSMALSVKRSRPPTSHYGGSITVGCEDCTKTLGNKSTPAGMLPWNLTARSTRPSPVMDQCIAIRPRPGFPRMAFVTFALSHLSQKDCGVKDITFNK